jgi:H+-translocating NAD(P) transhydrogenase subunit alpha
LAILAFLNIFLHRMTIGILTEQGIETRVSALPETVAAFIKLNTTVLVQSGAGAKSFASDEDYIAAGAQVVSEAVILADADIILSINAPVNVAENKIYLGAYQAFGNAALMQTWAKKGITTFSMDTIPRTTRAQAMDVLSSQANIAGYKAVLLAAAEYPRYLPMFMTAAGSIPPAKLLILGAGVAGLQAIATAKRLGAVVEVFDTRLAVKEEVQSLGAKFVEVEGAADASAGGGYAVEQTEEYKQKQQNRIAQSVAKSDIIITTAQIPGRKAPILLTEAMIASMRKGSVIVDLAASTGGNTPYTKNNETIVTDNGIKIIGDSNLPAMASSDASKVYGKNVLNFLNLIINKEGILNLNFDDDLVIGTCVTHAGEIQNQRIKDSLGN